MTSSRIAAEQLPHSMVSIRKVDRGFIREKGSI